MPPHALFAVIAYRLINFLVPTFPALLAHSSLQSLLDVSAGDRQAVGRPRPSGAE